MESVDVRYRCTLSMYLIDGKDKRRSSQARAERRRGLECDVQGSFHCFSACDQGSDKKIVGTRTG